MRGFLDGHDKFGCVDCVTGGAGGDDADDGRALRTGSGRELPGSAGGVQDGLGLESMGLVEALAQAGLPAGFEDGNDVVARHVGDEELHRVGPDVDDGTALHRVRAGCAR